METNSHLEFFTEKELLFFKAWARKEYNPLDYQHVSAKEIIMSTVWKKTILLSKKIVEELPEFSIKGGMFWSQRGWGNSSGQNKQIAVFKPYTWMKVHRKSDDGKDLFFTFGIDTSSPQPSFVYKLDLRRTRDSRLSQNQIDLADKTIPNSAKWCEIPFPELITLDFDSLLGQSINFILNQINTYDSLIKLLNDPPLKNRRKFNNLKKVKLPTNSKNNLKNHIRTFEEVDIDFLEQTKELMSIGKAGEDLVILYEKENLITQGRNDLADLVHKVKDGKGYDISSRNKDGSEKFIEVKTTTGQSSKPFYLSANEYEFSQKTANYHLYRLFNYNSRLNSAEFFILSKNISDNFILEPISYSVILK